MGYECRSSEVLLIKGLQADNTGQKPVKRGTNSYLRKLKDLQRNPVQTLFEQIGQKR